MAEFHWISDEIFTVSDFLTPEECGTYIQLAESIGFSDAPINTMFGTEIRRDVRNNKRVVLDDPTRAELLWRHAKVYVPEYRSNWSVVGVNERLRFYRYDVGQQFNWHFDGAFERENGERSQLTFMVYLNGDYDGGQTLFENVTIEPETGLALFFVHDIRHKGQVVTAGRKYVLRTDVMYRYC